MTVLRHSYDMIKLQKKSYNNLKIKLQQKLRYNYDHKIDVLNVNNNNENGERWRSFSYFMKSWSYDTFEIN